MLDTTTSSYFVNCHPTTVRHDDCLARSQISFDFLLWIIGGRPTATVSLAVDIATDDPGITWCYTPFTFRVARGLDVDIVFGRDWLSICRAVVSDGIVTFSPDTLEGRLFLPPPMADHSHSTETVSSPMEDVVWPDHTVPTVSRYGHSSEPGPSNISGSDSVTSIPSTENNAMPCANAMNERSRSNDKHDCDPRICSYLTSPLSSPLLVDNDALSDLCIRHGLEVTGKATPRQLRTDLIRHVFSADCSLHQLHVPDRALSISEYREHCRALTSWVGDPHKLVFDCMYSVTQADAQTISTDRLLLVLESLSSTRYPLSTSNLRYDCKQALQHCLSERLRGISTVPFIAQAAPDLSSTQSNLELLGRLLGDLASKSKKQLREVATFHGINYQRSTTRPKLESLLLSHLTKGQCMTRRDGSTVMKAGENTPEGCTEIQESVCSRTDETVSYPQANELQYHCLTALLKRRLSLKHMRMILDAHEIPYENNESLSPLKSRLKHFLNSVKKGKRTEKYRERRPREEARLAVSDTLEQVRSMWPQLTSKDLKAKILDLFLDMTSSKELKSETCASCAEEVLSSSLTQLYVDEIDWSPLLRPDRRKTGANGSNGSDDTWLDRSYPEPFIPPWPSLRDVLLDPGGVHTDDEGKVVASVCRKCLSFLEKGKTPPLSIANHNFIGRVPAELEGLTVVEEAMVSLCRAKCWIVKLTGKDEDEIHFENQEQTDRDACDPHLQKAMKGHIITYPQAPSELVTELPPALEDMCTYVCAIFVGSKPPTKQWLREKATPLYIRKEKVQKALCWLKTHNPLYRDIAVNQNNLDTLPEGDILPVHVEHLQPRDAGEDLTSRYDGPTHVDSAASIDEVLPTVAGEIPFEKVVITDVNGSASALELRKAAVKHFSKKGAGWLQIPHDPNPSMEFDNPDLFPMIFPTLFPYGMGGCEDSRRCSKLAFPYHIKHLLNLSDRRFQEHYSFMFIAFNMLQRRKILLHTFLKTKRSGFQKLAKDFADVSPEAAQAISERLLNGKPLAPQNEAEEKVVKLWQQVNVATTHVPGSSAARVKMRNEIRGLMMDKGLPSFYITINPADTRNPLVKFLAGHEIDVDDLLPEQVPKYREMQLLVAKNPAVAAKFFNLYMKAFIKALLGYDSTCKDVQSGVLGVVKGYYGCVEAQGRGSLHCHMLVWVEGGLNPNEIKKRVLEDEDGEFERRLIAFLDDTICTSIPDSPSGTESEEDSLPHPASIRAPKRQSSSEECDLQLRQDLRRMVSAVQVHKHTRTCFKYCKSQDSSEPKECRFDLRASNTREKTEFDRVTGELYLRQTNGLVNGYNPTIMSAMRCNMDIKFIGSGMSAKSILYYVTDYITKTQLKSHVAYATIAAAMKKMHTTNRKGQGTEEKGHALLRRCSYAMIQLQELSAQQVVSYIMDYEDHFTSHSYNQLHWRQFESHIQRSFPSVDCQNDHVSEPRSASLPVVDHEDQLDPVDEPRGSGTKEPIIRTEHDAESDTEDEEQPPHAAEDDDVCFVIGPNGELRARTGPVADYVQRGRALDGISLWEFTARIDKVRKTKQVVFDSGYCSEEEVDDSDAQNDLDDFIVQDDADDEVLADDIEMDSVTETQSTRAVSELDTILGYTGRLRPRVPFLDDHDEKDTHELKVVAPNQRRIPVLIGPSVPRRDREDVYERYCRCMLMLFCPWRVATDLREPQQTWATAFEQFRETCSVEVLKVIENMQVLHECKDSRDAEYARRRTRVKVHADDGDPYASRRAVPAAEVVCPDHEESELLDKLVSMEQTRSWQRKKVAENVKKCMLHARAGGMFTGSCRREKALQRFPISEDGLACKHVTDTYLEQSCKGFYEESRSLHRRNMSMGEPMETDSNSARNHTQRPVATLAGHDQAEDSSVTSGSHLPLLPSIAGGLPSTISESTVSIDEMVAEYTLNKEQARAFRIVAEHSLLGNVQPLRMFIGGPGGTGKSRVINALRDFFDRRGQGRRFRLASFTGVAAKNISGMTLHAALMLSQQGRRSTIADKTRRDLVSMWDGVDYLFVDEVSMISCKLLLKISDALAAAKQKQTNFGGINVIFAGDFAQLRPVCETRLFAHLKHARIATSKGQDDVHGKLLWLSVDTVVILTENKRQQGAHNQPFVQLLERLRFGRCTPEDHELLTSRLITEASPDWTSLEWSTAPVIVSDNAVKDKFNEMATIKFAKDTGREIHYYHARDSRNGKPVDSNELKDLLLKLDSGKTGQRLGKIPLVLGMPVMIAFNFDVGSGVVNGSQGILKEIRYETDAEGVRYLQSCIVQCSDMVTKNPYLGDREVIAIQDTVKFKLDGNATVARTQVPIFPAWSMTAHKAQGQTLRYVVVDVQGCTDPEAPYVMISRATSLEGLLILRPFEFSKINFRLSEELRKEFHRMDYLRLQTTIRHSVDDEEVLSARKELEAMGWRTAFDVVSPSSHHITADHDRMEDTAREVDRAQRHIDNLVANVLRSSSLIRRDLPPLRDPPPKRHSNVAPSTRLPRKKRRTK